MHPCNFIRELFFFINKYKSIVIIVINIISIKENILIVRGVMVEAKPSINKILKMFEPIIFPMAISVSPFFVATTEVTNSGREVPTATIVKPIKFSLIPRVVAIFVAESTTISPPHIIPIIPTVLSKIVLKIGISFIICNAASPSAVVAASVTNSLSASLALFMVITKK